jgi:acyl-CoA synthetase (AMP-forming)/AMP-acid ligase II
MLTGDMLRRAAHRHPGKAAILFNGAALSYRDLNGQANRLAHAVLAAGLPKQAKVGILSRNRPEYGVAFSASPRAAASPSTSRSSTRRTNSPSCSTRPMSSC